MRYKAVNGIRKYVCCKWGLLSKVKITELNLDTGYGNH